MVQLLLFLSYVILFAAVAWQLTVLARQPEARTLGRVAFAAAGGVVIAGIVYYGILH